MLEKLSGDAVEPEQLARLHEIVLSQPLRPAQGSAGAEVEWWKLGSMVLGRACIFRASVLWYVVFFSMAVDDRGLNRAPSAPHLPYEVPAVGRSVVAPMGVLEVSERMLHHEK